MWDLAGKSNSIVRHVCMINTYKKLKEIFNNIISDLYYVISHDYSLTNSYEFQEIKKHNNSSIQSKIDLLAILKKNLHRTILCYIL